jgi:hypothetical protein
MKYRCGFQRLPVWALGVHAAVACGGRSDLSEVVSSPHDGGMMLRADAHGTDAPASGADGPGCATGPSPVNRPGHPTFRIVA